MFKLQFFRNIDYSPETKVFRCNTHTKIKKINNEDIKNHSNIEDSISIIESYVHLKNWINEFSDIYKNYLKPILYPFALLVLIELLKKKFSVEAKFFFSIFISDLNVKHKTVFDLLKSKFDNNPVNFKQTNIYVFTKLIHFFEKNLYLHFLKYIYRFFKIKFLTEHVNFIKKPETNFQNLSINKSILNIPKNILKANKINFSKKKLEIQNIDLQKKLKFYKTLKIFCKNYNSINSISTSSDENTVVSGFDNSIIKVFDFINNSNKNLSYSLIGHSASVSCVKISHCNNFFISSSVNGELNLWSLEYKKLLMNYENFNKPIWDISFSNKESFFTTATGNFISTLWITDRIFPIRFFIGHKSDVNVSKWHPNGLLLATGSDDRTVRLWDIKSAKSVFSYKKFDNNIYNIEFSPDGLEMCISGLVDYIDIWDLRTGKTLKRFKYRNSETIVKNIAYSPDGQFLLHNINSKFVNFINRKNFKYFDFKLLKHRHVKNFYSRCFNFQKIFQIKFNSNEKVTIIGI